jgi:hypothetical protein
MLFALVFSFRVVLDPPDFDDRCGRPDESISGEQYLLGAFQGWLIDFVV